MRAETRRKSGKSESKNKEREKTIKILKAHDTVTVHICTVTIAIVHLCTILHTLMWVFFCSKYVKSVIFSILHNFAHINGDVPHNLAMDLSYYVSTLSYPNPNTLTELSLPETTFKKKKNQNFDFFYFNSRPCPRTLISPKMGNKWEVVQGKTTLRIWWILFTICTPSISLIL